MCFYCFILFFYVDTVCGFTAAYLDLAEWSNGWCYITNKRTCCEFESRRLRNLFFSSVRAGDNTNGFDSVPLDTSGVWRGEGPGDHCYKVDQIPRTRKHLLVQWLGDMILTSDSYFVGFTALPIRALSQR